MAFSTFGQSRTVLWFFPLGSCPRISIDPFLKGDLIVGSVLLPCHWVFFDHVTECGQHEELDAGVQRSESPCFTARDLDAAVSNIGLA